MKLSDWCRKYDISRPWATTLCQQGRIAGALIERGWWLIPVDAPVPERKVNKHIERMRVLRDEEKVLEARVRMLREQVKGLQAIVRNAVMTDAMRERIDTLLADDWVVVEGSGVWLDADSGEHPKLAGWNSACETYALAREKELRGQS